MRARAALAWLTWPAIMGGSVAAAAWGFARGLDPGLWAFVVSAGNFVLLVGLEQGVPRRPDVNLFRDPQVPNDLAHGVLIAGGARPLAGALVAALLGVLALSPAAEGGAWWPHDWPYAAQVALTLGFVSFGDYWVHRALHRVGFLWPFHALHHSSRALHVLKGNRMHASEELLKYVLVPVPLLLLGVPAECMLWMALWSNFDGSLAHCNVDQRFPSWFHYLVPNVLVHSVHHSEDPRHQDSNFGGTIVLWDLLFGTYRHPDRNPVVALGLEGDPVPDGFLRQLAQPFGRERRSLVGG